MIKKLSLLPVLALVLTFAAGVPSAFAAANPTVEVDVMTHLCNPSIKNMADFQALAKGLDPIAGFAKQVLACPTTVLPKDMPVMGTVADPQTNYQYSVMGEHNASLSLANSMFHAEKLCESDINVDVNGDGKVSSDTCLDTSEYHFNTVQADNGKIEVQEVTPPQGYHYGTLLFTPVQVDGNNDKQSLLATDDVKGLIKLDTTADADKVITLHVYDFANSDNPQGNVNGMPIPMPGMSSTTTSTNMGTTSQASIISQIQALEMQIQVIEAQIVALLAKLVQ